MGPRVGGGRRTTLLQPILSQDFFPFLHERAIGAAPRDTEILPTRPSEVVLASHVAPVQALEDALAACEIADCAPEAALRPPMSALGGYVEGGREWERRTGGWVQR